MTNLAKTVREALLEAADPAKAPAMQAYMKSQMPFAGVAAVPLDKICKRLFRELNYSSRAQWQHDVLALWDGAKFREERYAALDLCNIRAAKPFQTLDALPMYEHMVVTGAWWDYVDTIAAWQLGVLLHKQPAPIKRAMRQWSQCDDMWKRRSAILCQLKAKESTDLAFLYACIETSMDSNEFFLRKAIGWALREYAWTDPVEIARYVKANNSRLSGLSQREALKHVRKT